MKSLWAFEPFHQSANSLKAMHKILHQLVGSPQNIEVGFVVTRTESFLNLAFDIPEDQRYTLYPRKLIKQELKNARIKTDDKNIHVVNCPTMSSTKAVDCLLKLASDRGVEIIGLFTQAQKGYLRFALGSFAETAIHRSKVSLLVFNPKTKASTAIKKTLFASDFSSSSKAHLKTVISQCKKLDSKLVVFHHAEVIYNWSFDESHPKIQAYRKTVNKMKAWIEQECIRAGVSAQVVVASDMKATSDLIFLNMKRHQVDLVVVSAKVGPLAALVGGSTTRKVIRGSAVPVLVLK